MGVGLARACLDDAVTYAREREAFGRSITQFQAIRHSLAEMRTELEAARLLRYEAAMVSDGGSETSGVNRRPGSGGSPSVA